MKILVVAPSWIGDTLLAQPLFTLLKRQSPSAYLAVLAAGWCAPLLNRMVEVDNVINNPFAHGEFNFTARRRLGLQLRDQAFDQAYVLPNTWKSALVPYFADIPQRIGYQGESRYILLNQRHRQNAALHPQLAQRYAALSGPLPSELPQPQLRSTSEQQLQTRLALNLSATATPIVFCPGAEYGPAKRWPASHFASLARQVASLNDPVWIIGSEKDQSIGEEISAASNGTAINLCGKTSLDQAVDLIAGARAVVSNDSGLMHVAAALDRPLMALYGSSSPTYTPPLSQHATIIQRQLPCSPCFKRVCPLGHFDCLNGLSPDQVEIHLRKLQ